MLAVTLHCCLTVAILVSRDGENEDNVNKLLQCFRYFVFKAWKKDYVLFQLDDWTSQPEALYKILGMEKKLMRTRDTTAPMTSLGYNLNMQQQHETDMILVCSQSSELQLWNWLVSCHFQPVAASRWALSIHRHWISLPVVHTWNFIFATIRARNLVFIKNLKFYRCCLSSVTCQWKLSTHCQWLGELIFQDLLFLVWMRSVLVCLCWGGRQMNISY